MSVVVRFAPSPTGFLHIGGARTALFNWLFARHHKGKFLLRIEDTDQKRSTQEAVDAIFKSLRWLGLNWDADPIFQFQRASRHAEIAHQLLKEGKAYYCYCSPEELEVMKEKAREKGLPPRYNGHWRDSKETPPSSVKPVIRFKAPQEGETVIQDHVQGRVCLQNAQLDDMVLLRADGTPTYMLSVIVDDFDMGITHIIRGDDHLTNAFRQKQLILSCGWTPPEYAHIPLIHGSDGAKLSKRHGAIGTEEYQKMGILPETMRNYLLRLGFGYGDHEIISTQQAIDWFDLSRVGKSPSRLDMAKLLHLNSHYMRHIDNKDLMKILDLREDEKGKERVFKGIDSLKERAKTLVELKDSCAIYLERPVFENQDLDKDLLKKIYNRLEEQDFTSKEVLHDFFKSLSHEWELGVGKLAAPLRVALTGKTVSPNLFEIMEILGKEETLVRIKTVL